MLTKDTAFCVIRHLKTLNDVRNFSLVCKTFYQASKMLLNNVSEEYEILSDTYNALPVDTSQNIKFPSFQKALTEYLYQNNAWDEYYLNLIND